MKAWQFTGVNEPLALNDVPIPQPDAGEILIQVAASGLCHTDVGICTDEAWAPRLGRPPLTLGHEVAGTVVALGPGVTSAVVGDRVGVSPAGVTRPGLARDGGYAPYCVAAVADLVPVPEAVTMELAALGTDAGRASYRAIFVRGEARRGMRIGVIGLGGLGQIGTAIAAMEGIEVYAVDIKPASESLARRLGAVDFATDIRQFKNADLELIVDFAGAGTTTRDAIATVREGGRVVQTGLGNSNAAISLTDLVFNQVTLIGSRGGTTADITRVYEYFASGSFDPVIHRIEFDQIPWALDALAAGRVEGRFVVDFTA